ncbi:MAG: hypothetical protein HZB23_07545 [Deltaproteobacteria bacterium]|nr:hypothetical protein [Deltaproteobacteria bacterium]
MTAEDKHTVNQRRRRMALRVLTAGFVLALAAVVPPLILEGFFYLAVRNPGVLSYAPEPVRAEVQVQYWINDAREIQYLPSCARYDPTLGYTLKPGTCTFSNIEFSNGFSVNQAGLRDDAESLSEPEIIVAGDSQAMGWGVDQEDSFPQQLERLTGKKVLNAGVSSYGTVREMALASRFFSPRLKVLIIQYSDNDYSENLAFEKGGNRMKPMPRSKYDALAILPGDKDYRFFQYMKYEYVKLRYESGFRRNMAPPPVPSRIAELFLNAVAAYGGQGLSGVSVIAFEVGPHNVYTGFSQGLVKERLSSRWPDWAGKIVVLDLSKILRPEDFYILDGHLTRTGHDKVARLLTDALGAGTAKTQGISGR